MRYYRFVLLAALAAVVFGAVWLWQRKPATTYAAEARPAPGQLTILGKDGKPAGLCPLKHTDVQADVAGYVARVSVTQEFENPTKEPIEAVYTFPLPGDAAVDDMTMVIGTRTVKGQIKRREEAREIYEAAKTAGKAAALLDQERPNLFTQSVANILPGEKVTITIRYVNLLKYEEGKYEFVFPMVVGPRYTPGGGYKEPGKRGEPSPAQKIDGDPGATAVVTDADKITPPITPPGTRAGHDISLTVNLDAGLPLREVKSQLHEVAVRRQGRTRATVQLRNQKEIPNKDFILRYSAAGADIQSGVLAYAPGGGQVASAKGQALAGSGGYFTLIIQPPSAPPRDRITPKEMVFVIDQTGSQMGWPIEKAKETMRHCIQNLNPGDTFQLLGFNTEVYPCFPAPVPATPENLQKALAYLEPLKGAGGTDILKAADYALKIPDDPDRLRIICYLTDGYVGNDMQIIDYIKKHRGSARMFPFGVGNSVNRFLIDGMAREGRGAAEYVTLNAPGESAAAKFYRRVADPILLDVEVDWNELPVEDVYPRHIPDVFSAAPIIVKGRYTRAAEGDITIHGLLRGKPWSQTIRVSFPAVKADGSAIATLWAREKIEDLQSQDWLGAQTRNPNPEIKEQIINTALEYRLMSQYTSFVAVEERVVNVGGKQRTIDVPVEMPEGVAYEGIFGEGERKEVMYFRGALGRSSTAKAARTSLGAASGNLGAGVGGAGAATPSAPAPTVSAPVAEGAADLATRSNLSRYDTDIAAGTAEGQKRLDAMKPEARRALLAQVKLAPALRGLADKVAKEGTNGSLDKPGVPKVEKGRVEVQIWLNSLPPEGLAKLKALDFALSATLTPNKLLLGTVAVDKLDALVELSFVRRVEPPRFK
jgi:Ca-activated chloride channel family protein